MDWANLAIMTLLGAGALGILIETDFLGILTLRYKGKIRWGDEEKDN